MKSNIKKEFIRMELADYLENIARQLRSGTDDTEGRQWSVPQTFEARIKHKEKNAALKPSSNGAGRLWQIMTLPRE